MAVMSKRLDHVPLTFHLLYESPLISARDYRCRACQSGPGPEEHSHSNDIVLLRHGAFCKHFGSRRITADGNQAVYFAQGSSYRVSHPGDCGDRGATFAVAPRVLNDIIRQLDPDVDDHQPQHISDSVRVTPPHQLPTAETTVSSDGDLDLGPSLTESLHQEFQQRPGVFAGVDLAGPEIGCHELITAKDVQRQEAVMVVVAMERPQLLVAVGRIVGCIEIEREMFRWLVVGRYEPMDQD
jgi:hypothetical protein